LQLARGVCINSIICLNDNKPFASIAGGGRESVRRNICKGAAAEGTGVGGEGCGEAGGVEGGGIWGGLKDYAKVSEVEQHLGLGGCEGGFGVGLAKFEGAEHEKEREDVDRIHT